MIRAFVRDDREQERFAGANTELIDVSLGVGRLMALMFPAVMLVLNFSSVAVLWFGGHLVASGSMQIGALTAFLSLPDADPDVGDDGDVHVHDGAARRGLRRAHRGGAGHRARRRPAGAARCARPPCTASWSCATWSSAIPGAAEPVLRDISLPARPGEITAIIGGTGSGKTTLLNLIPRLFDATGGAVLVDGVDVRELDPAVLSGRGRPGAAEAVPVLRDGRRPTCATASPTPPTRSSGRRWRSRRPGTSSSGWTAGWTRRSPRAAPTSPAASASGWRSPARSCTGRRSTCSTTRSRRSTTPPTPRCGPRWRPRPRTRRCVIVAQRVATIRHADRIIVLDEGRVVATGTHAELMDTRRDLPGDRAVPADRAGGSLMTAAPGTTSPGGAPSGGGPDGGGRTGGGPRGPGRDHRPGAPAATPGGDRQQAARTAGRRGAGSEARPRPAARRAPRARRLHGRHVDREGAELPRLQPPAAAACCRRSGR